MPTIPNCIIVAIEHRGVTGEARWPASHGPAAQQIARALAMAEAAQLYPVQAPIIARQLEQEYDCTHPNCPVVKAYVEAPEEFRWRRLHEGRIGDQMGAVWLLEMQFLVACFPGAPGDGEDEEGASRPISDYGYFDEDGAWRPLRALKGIKKSIEEA